MSGIIFGEYEPSRTPTERGPDAIIGVFFDGTGNNRKNVRAYKASKGEAIVLDSGENRQQYLDAYKKHKEDSDGNNSYNSDESNVSRLEPLYINDDVETFKLYVEGIGTESFESDSDIGSALGVGSTGIKGRVKEACNTIATETLSGINSEDKDTNGNIVIEKVVFDVYGFSRGAAAARHFVSQVKKPSYTEYVSGGHGYLAKIEHPAYGYLGKALKDAKIVINTIEIRFAGLYDSVASYGIKHSNDYKELKMNQLFHVKKTVHLISQDEIRYNFDLTDITSAGSKGLTISLPGVHSDIGGGYLQNIPKENVLLWDLSNNEDESLKKYEYFIAEGWYKEHEIDLKDGWTRDEIYGRRKDLSNKYSVLPLKLMGKLSHEYKAKIKTGKLERDFKTEGALLKEVEKRLDAQFTAKYTKKITRIDLLKFDSKENEKELLAKKRAELQKAADEWRKHLESLKKKPKTQLFENYDVKVDNTRIVQPIRHILVEKKDFPTSTNYTVLSDSQLLRALRNKYLHISFDYRNYAPPTWTYFVGIGSILSLSEPMKPRKSGKRMIYVDTK